MSDGTMKPLVIFPDSAEPDQDDKLKEELRRWSDLMILETKPDSIALANGHVTTENLLPQERAAIKSIIEAANDYWPKEAEWLRRVLARFPVPASTAAANDDRRIVVCDRCLTASCWAYIFTCDQAVEAGTTIRTIGELRRLDREHPSYWDREEVQAQS